MLRICFALFFCLAMFSADAAVRIKDISALRGVRDNQLLGYGLVVGLQNSGDTLLNSTFTQQALESMLDRMGINVRGTAMRTRNVAAVLVTADVQTFSGQNGDFDAAHSFAEIAIAIVN